MYRRSQSVSKLCKSLSPKHYTRLRTRQWHYLVQAPHRPKACLLRKLNPKSSESYSKQHLPFGKRRKEPFQDGNILDTLAFWTVLSSPFLIPILAVLLLSMSYDLESELEVYVEDFVSLLFGDTMHLRPTMKQEQGVYNRLPPDCIRILRLEPGSADEPLYCGLFSVKIADTSRYEALSYYWGDPTPKFTIFCNKLPLEIPENLHAALVQLRHANNHKDLWVDAVCINQADTKERGEQVQNMPRIYARARKVIVWIGQEEWGIEGCFRLLRQQKVSWGVRMRFGPKPPWSKEGVKFQTTSTIANFTSSDWKLVEKVLERPWFRRAWVLQEVAYARSVEIICGSKSLDWRHLANTIRDANHIGLVTERFSPMARAGAQNIIEMESCRKQLRDKEPQTLINTLLATNSTQCSDDRDKLFAILSLSQDYNSLSCDYTNTSTEVFHALAIRELIIKQNALYLSCTTNKLETVFDGLASLPSWAPDWTRIENDQPFIRYKDRIPFRASADHYSEHMQIRVLDDDLTLVLHGVPIDTIQAVQKDSTFEKTPLLGELDEKSYQGIQRNRMWILECAKLYRESARDLSTLSDQFWRPMTCELTGEGYPARGNFDQLFAQYLKFLDSIYQVILRPDAMDSTSLDFVQKQINAYRTPIAEIESSLSMWGSRRKFALTERRLVAWVPRKSQKGDVVFLVSGCPVPYVLRKSGDQSFRLVGEAYVQGVMDGSRWNEADIVLFKVK
jgi:hypothetical protein